MITLKTDQIQLEVSPHGAEPRSLRDSSGRELLWQADDPWNRSACILFPAICRHEGDVIRSGTRAASETRSPREQGDEQTLPMSKHGLARDLDFEMLEREESRAAFELHSSADTLTSYPWDFTLRVEYTVEKAVMTTRYTVSNRTDSDHDAGTTMPYALGSHPAFMWPLPDKSEGPGSAATGQAATGQYDARDALTDTGHSRPADDPVHVLEFVSPTPTTFRRLEADLLLPTPHDTVAELGAVGSLIPLKRSFFEPGAVLFPDVADTGVVYRRIDGKGPRIRMTWSGFDTLTLWSAPGGNFVCIEPWAGRPQEVGSTTPDTDRTDLCHLAPGESRTHEYRLDIS